MTTRRPALALLALALLPGLAACGSSSDKDSSSGAAASKASVTITAAKGCSIDHSTLAAGGIDFTVKNVDATAVSEVEVLSGDRIVGEKENLPPGFSGTFSITATAGDYTLYCPGAATEKSALKVTGKSAAVDTSAAALAKQASKGYANYVTTQVGYLLAEAKNLNKALQGNDLTAAQAAYAKARPFYEKIEPVAESFPGLDAAIDARADGISPTKLTGFHRIEYGLFQVKSLNGLAKYGAGLIKDVTNLQTKTKQLAAKNMPYQLTELANGAQGLLDEVASSKITGEEERYSHIDMLDFANNDEGAEQAFAQLVPILKTSDPALVKQIQQRFNALNTLVDQYRDTSEPSGYKLYTALTKADKRKLAAAVKAVQEPLSKVASKVAG
ncbi:MAG TPA: iron uptake system protein EfeO [Marmoricola sp.]